MMGIREVAIMNRGQAARNLRAEIKSKDTVNLPMEGGNLDILVAGKKVGAAYTSNGYLVMIPWGKYKIGEYSDGTFHPGTAVDCLEVERGKS